MLRSRWIGGAAGPALLTFFASLVVRIVLIAAFPANIGLDGFQRWAGRDWLLVQGWLPGPQLLVWTAAHLGAGVAGTRLLMALVASLALAAGCVLAQQIGGRRAGWMFLAPAAFGPYSLWGSALYQEGLFLLLLFTGLSLAFRGRLILADLVLGALGLVRFEAFPLLLLYVHWRRAPRALLVGWGAGIWTLGRALGWEGHTASPIDYFSDWQGLFERFTVAGWFQDGSQLLVYAWDTGALIFAIAALVGLRTLEGGGEPARVSAKDNVPGSPARAARLVARMVGVQLALVGLWMVGLERATPRMLIVPTMLTAVIGVGGLARLWEQEHPQKDALRRGLFALLAVVGWVSVVNAWRAAETEARFSAPERLALEQMAACPDCRWWMSPRVGLGPRDRHDGCEILQGVSELRHGRDFVCAVWPDDADAWTRCQGSVTWSGTAYVVTPGPLTPGPVIVGVGDALGSVPVPDPATPAPGPGQGGTLP